MLFHIIPHFQELSNDYEKKKPGLESDPAGVAGIVSTCKTHGSTITGSWISYWKIYPITNSFHGSATASPSALLKQTPNGGFKEQA
jgi:hypothetical protein